jgi:hypothetical protein
MTKKTKGVTSSHLFHGRLVQLLEDLLFTDQEIDLNLTLTKKLVFPLSHDRLVQLLKDLLFTAQEPDLNLTFNKEEAGFSPLS